MPPRKKRDLEQSRGSAGERRRLPILEEINNQIEAAATDLRAYSPTEIDWSARAVATADSLIPWLIGLAPGLKDYVENVLNAPRLLRSMWAEMRPHVDVPTEQLEAFDRQLTFDDVLRESVNGEVVSRVVTKYLLENHPTSSLEANGRSDYPDLYLGTRDYSALPRFERKKKVSLEDEYGAASKGARKRPVRVPDGLEIKTCRDRVAVDCHHPHAGMHLVLLFAETARLFTVTDLRIAFLRKADYRESERNTTATTVKYSFGGDCFRSLLSDVK